MSEVALFRIDSGEEVIAKGALLDGQEWWTLWDCAIVFPENGNLKLQKWMDHAEVSAKSPLYIHYSHVLFATTPVKPLTDIYVKIYPSEPLIAVPEKRIIY